MENNNKFLYHRHLRLGPAIGDWTTLQYSDAGIDDVHISLIQNANFDSVPRKFVERLHYLHYRFAEDLVKQFSIDMDIKVELHSITAVQMTYGEFLSQQKKHRAVQSDYHIQDFGRINVIFSWDLADVIVNRLTGGEGEESDLDVFTNTESIILESQTHSILPLFIKHWRGVLDSASVTQVFNVGEFQYDQKVSLRESYLSFTFYLYFGKGDLKKVSWAYPSSLIKRLVKAMDALQDESTENVQLNPDTKKDIEVDVLATIGQAKLTMNELQNLQIGDIVSLDRSYDTHVDILLGESVRLKGQPGIVDNKVCVQLLASNVKKSVSGIPEISHPDTFSESDVSIDSTSALVSSESEEVLEELDDVAADIDVDIELENNNDSEELQVDITDPMDSFDELEALDSEDPIEDEPSEAVPVDNYDSNEELDDDFGDFSWDDLDEDDSGL